MNPERRSCARRILFSPEFLDIGTDNGGVVVNLSEGGLAFQAVGQVEPDSEVALSFSIGLGYRIDVLARVVWIGSRGNSGGVLFRKLSDDSRNMIREWLAKLDSERQSSDAASIAGATGLGDTFAAADELPEIPASQTPSFNIVAHSKGQVSAEPAAPLFPPRNADNLFARPRQEQSSRSKRGHPVLIVTLILCASIAAAMAHPRFVRAYREKIGAVILRLGNTVAGPPVASGARQNASPSLAATPSVMPSASTEPKPPAHASTPGATPRTPKIAPRTAYPATSKSSSQPALPLLDKPSGPPSAVTLPESQPPVAAMRPASTDADKRARRNPALKTPAAASQILAQKEYLRAKQYLQGLGVEPDPATAAEWFWRSLEAGDADAAIPLANLYLRGQGVSRSCTQARILLDLAAQKGKDQAIRELAQLPENCQ